MSINHYPPFIHFLMEISMKKSCSVITLLVACSFLSSCTFFLGINNDNDIALHMEPAWQTEAIFENPESVVFDPVAKILLVSNVNGPPMKKDGNGYLSKVALNGVVLDRMWLTGLDGPKGMALHENTLYVADITNLAVIDLSSARMKKYQAKGSKFLNDVTIDKKGRVYVSDMYTDTIYIFTGDQLKVWLRTSRLASPNGLFAYDNSLYVGSWGVRRCGLETDVPGHLLKVDLDTQKISDVGNGSLLANLDGVEGLGRRGFLVTDGVEGSLIHLSTQAEIIETIHLGRGAADLAVLPADWELVIVPMMRDNLLKAFTLPVP